jgi:DNA-binding transcriptional LysR family regulator
VVKKDTLMGSPVGKLGLTAQGRAFHARAQSLLQEWARLGVHARQLAMGEESELRVVIGDLCPLPETLALLSRFFARCPGTRLSLHFETVGGPLERLFDDQVDLILHRVEKSDTRLEWIDLGTVPMLPVLAPGLLVLVNDGHDVRPEQLRELTQCVLRDSARHSAPQDYFIVPGASQCTVPDQLMKKELILQGMAWGHLPAFLIERELREGRLKSVAGQPFPGRVEELVAARRRDQPHGPVASSYGTTFGHRHQGCGVSSSPAPLANEEPCSAVLAVADRNRRGKARLVTKRRRHPGGGLCRPVWLAADSA